MANKKQLLAIAKELGLTDIDINWTKREMEEAIAQAEAEVAELEAEKPAEEAEVKPEEEPEKTVEVDVGIMKATVSAGPDGEFGTEDDEVDITPIQPHVEPVEPEPEPEPVEPPKVIEDVPIPVAPPEPPPAPPKPAPKAPEPKPLANTYKCITGLTYKNVVYTIGDNVVMDDEAAKVHVKDGAIGPVDATQAKVERAKGLPAGEYKLIYDLTLEGHVHLANSTINLTEEQANLYEEIGAIEAR